MWAEKLSLRELRYKYFNSTTSTWARRLKERVSFAPVPIGAAWGAAHVIGLYYDNPPFTQQRALGENSAAARLTGQCLLQEKNTTGT